MIKKSLSTKFTFLLIVFSLLLGVTIGVVTYSAARQSYIELNSEKVKDTVRSIPAILDGDQIQAYIEEMKGIEEKDLGGTKSTDTYKAILEDEGYLKIETLLNNKKREYEYSYLYIFIPSKDHFTYFLEANVDNEKGKVDDLEYKIAHIGDIYTYEDFEYENLVPDVEALVKDGTDKTDKVQVGGNSIFGESIQVWAPIYNSKGEFVAMIEADLLLPNVVAEIMDNYQSVFLAIIFIIILIAIIQFNATRVLLIKPLDKLNAKMFAYASNDELDVIENEIFTGDEMQTLSETFCKMAADIKTYMVNLATVTAEREKAATELNVAKQIQESVLPSIFPPFPNRKEFDIFAIMNPAKEVGGDFYDFFMVDENRIAFIIADVSGKGIPAALFMMISKALIKNLALSHLEVNEIFEKANSQLNENNETFMFVTAFMGILDLKTGILSFVNGGHNPPLIKRVNGKFEWLSMEKNCILAVMPGMKFAKQEIQFNEGDKLFTYTDGVTEAINDKHEFYSDPHLKTVLDLIVESDIVDIRQIVYEVRKSINDFANKAEQADDITMLLLEYKQVKGKEVENEPRINEPRINE